MLESTSQGDNFKNFKDVFKLRNSECPLQGWEDGKRATLIQKEKAIAAAFRGGKLYLTKSYLCFWRSRVFSQKNITIPLCDVTKLEKMKPFSFLPGSGMSIEIHVSSVEKPYVFGAIINRDEVFNQILQVAQAAQLAWAKEGGSEEEHAPSDDDADISD
ncbi:GRAM domain-containing protein 4-like [Anneissia japonica]|uniref:GRAM domain-containing protein 4-like n=1 Tax=Anneissia japonica TaxID=1529436 RepID=UPI0014255757|nr:GRAM domain-containing protein 4-like [Anneissia japonica]